MELKIALAGKIASGKSTIAKALSTHFGCDSISFSQVLRLHLASQGASSNRTALQELGRELLDRYGNEGFLDWVIEKTPHLAWDGTLIIDGFRHPDVYRRLQERYSKTILVFCAVSDEDRILRIMTRDSLERETVLQLINDSTEQFVDQLRDAANLIVHPSTTIDEIIAHLRKR
ncbi:AAA family ATPase [Patescibacteria group bacterium]